MQLIFNFASKFKSKAINVSFSKAKGNTPYP